MPDVLLVVPPCASAALPILGPSVLVAACRAEGISAAVRYVNVELAARVGYEPYRRLALSCTRMHGEMLFAEAAWGRPVRIGPEDFDAERDSVTREDFDAALAEVPALIRDTADAIAEQAPRVVGFSSVFQQNLASVALAKAVRARLPDAVLLLGGANASRPMADGIAAATGAFDHIVAGEADLAFPGLVRDLLAGRRPPERVVDVGPVPELDAVPVPAYDDYFDAVAPHVAAGRLPEGLPIELPFESSRGCWWGQRSHCTFCGLNGLEMNQRDKSPGRVLDEITSLSRRWGSTELRASDNILPFPVLREVLPELARRRESGGPELEFFYEVKSSMRRKDLAVLRRAGVRRVQPGVESLSSSVLRAIAKGTNGPDSIAFLRDASAEGITLYWNLMVGFPGDEREDYEALLRLIPLIEHLQPPVATAPVRIDRYSPYFQAPERYGIRAVRPLPGMERVWPEGAPIETIAYHFEGDMDSPYRDDPALGRRVTSAIAGWHARWEAERPRLEAVPDGEGLRVRDSRRSALEPEIRLGPAAAALLLDLEKPAPVERVEEEADPTALDELLFCGFVVQHEGRLVSVVVRPAREDA